MVISNEQISFKTRKSRTDFVNLHYSPFFGNNILDVGCFEAPLRHLVKNINYTGVDIAGDPDIQLNLEEVSLLPFIDNQFDFVMCIEVLEHIDNLHQIFDDLFRVSKKYILVSLPNCWGVARRKIERGKGHFSHYGLPLDKPIDRHKWFVNITQSRKFFEGKINESIKLVDLRVVEKPRLLPVRFYRKILYPGERYLNRYAHTLFALYEKC